MKELDEKFEGTGEVKGVQFTQTAKSDKAYIYERDDEGGAEVAEQSEEHNDDEQRSLG